MCLGCRVRGSGNNRVWSLGDRVDGLGVTGSGSRVWSLGSRVEVQGLELRV